MRTTLSLDDDVLIQVKHYAEIHSISLGKAASEVLRRGLSRPLPTTLINGLHVYSPPEGAPPITLEDIQRLDDELS